MSDQFEVGGGYGNPVTRAMKLDVEDKKHDNDPALSRDDWKQIGVALTVLTAVGILISRMSL